MGCMYWTRRSGKRSSLVFKEDKLLKLEVVLLRQLIRKQQPLEMLSLVDVEAALDF